jgi:hypothetical protein
MNHFLRALSLACLVGCGGGSNVEGTAATSSSTGSAGGTGGADGGPSHHCAVDCSTLKTEPCTVAVCNTGQLAGPLDVCVVAPAPDGMACDDGLFCTTHDTCAAGVCVGGPANDCGMVAASCSSVLCQEASKSCTVAPAADGSACTPADLCQVAGACQAGVCAGQPKDCTFSPLSECNTVACDSTTGMCAGTPDPTQDGMPCVLTGDLCSVNKACSSGQCVGGTPQDCSGLDLGCQVGACDTTTGLCGTVDAAVGTACTQDLLACQVGACGMMGTCVPAMAPNGAACNDHDACTQADACTAGVCAGTSIAGCKAYFQEGFETCPDGWTFKGDWQCGTPTAASPVTPHTGHGVLATQLDGLYHNDQSYDTCFADSPSIDLTTAVSPMAFFWAWVDTEGTTYDGWNVKVSIDGAQSFQEVTKVTPPYPLTISSQAAYGGDLSALGWQPYVVDLSDSAGQASVILRYAFESDQVTVRPGVYIDDLIVAEAAQIPLYITTPSQLQNVHVGQGLSVQLAKVGGTSSATWSLVGGKNDGWLTLLPNGLLSGTAVQAGPVSITVEVEEMGLTSNFDEQTFTFNVIPDVYYTSFEGICPDDWTLIGDWKCGSPVTVGPATAYDGVQCIGTGMGQNYSSNDTWTGTTATSPEIDLTGVPNPTLTFRLWIDTQGGTSDGANLEISSNGGTSYDVLEVTPGYPLSIAGEEAWGGHDAGLGWQLMQADLTPYSGTKVLLRFGFRSDATSTFAGAYVDDFLVE